MFIDEALKLILFAFDDASGEVWSKWVRETELSVVERDESLGVQDGSANGG